MPEPVVLTLSSRLTLRRFWLRLGVLVLLSCGTRDGEAGILGAAAHLSWLVVVVCGATALLRRERPAAAELTHWDEALGFAAVALGARSLHWLLASWGA